MKRRACALLVLSLAGPLACSSPPRRTLPSGIPTAPEIVRVGVTEAGRLTIREESLERYVQATILSEFAPASEDVDVAERMLEVQAVIGRTYALAHLGRHAHDGYDLCDGTHCQLYQPARLNTSRWGPQAAEAVRRTQGQVLWYDGAPALAVFHADCGGRTSAAADVWGGMLRPYLVSAADDGPAADVHRVWRYESTRRDVLAALNADPRTRVGARFDGMDVLDRDIAGRAERVTLEGSAPRVVRGDVLREVLSGAFGARSIKSTWFDVRVERGMMIFEGRGFGHGVGLCQAGALARIRAGAALSAVLQRYFPGTALVKLG
jgi:stage II sporulation protein D